MYYNKVSYFFTRIATPKKILQNLGTAREQKKFYSNKSSSK